MSLKCIILRDSATHFPSKISCFKRYFTFRLFFSLNQKYKGKQGSGKNAHKFEACKVKIIEPLNQSTLLLQNIVLNTDIEQVRIAALWVSKIMQENSPQNIDVNN